MWFATLREYNTTTELWQAPFMDMGARRLRENMTGIGFHMIDWEIPKKVEEAELILNMLMTFDVCQQLCVNQTYAIDIPTGETVYPVTYGPNGTNTTHNATAGMLHQTVPCLGIEFFPKWASALWNATSRTYDIHITALSDGPVDGPNTELIAEIGTDGCYYHTNLFMSKHFVQTSLFDVQNLTFKRQNGLKFSFPASLSRTTGRFTLY